MNKRGTIAIYFFMLAVVFIILAISLGDPLVDSIGETKNSTEINCPTATTYQDKAVCGQLDSFPFFYVALALGFAGVIIKAIGR